MALREMASSAPLPKASWFDDVDEEDEAHCLFDRVGGVAVVRIEGALAQRAGWWWDGYDAIRERFSAALADASTNVIALRINSPGGMVSGCFDAARAMRAEARASGKTVLAFADEMACSAAYSLATCADQLWLPQTGVVGSIGVICSLLDRTKMTEEMGLRIEVITSGELKADGHPDKPLQPATVSRVQAHIDELGKMFAELVAHARGDSAERLLSLEGQAFHGAHAVDAGIADHVGSFDEFMRQATRLAESVSVGKGLAAIAAKKGI